MARHDHSTVPAGTVGQPPYDNGSAFQLNVETQGRLSEPEQFAKVVIRTDADGRQVLREHDRVRADVLADAPREHEVSPGGLVGLAAADLHSLAVVDVPVTVLHEHSAEDALEVALARDEPAVMVDNLRFFAGAARTRLRMPNGSRWPARSSTTRPRTRRVGATVCAEGIESHDEA